MSVVHSNRHILPQLQLRFSSVRKSDKTNLIFIATLNKIVKNVASKKWNIKSETTFTKDVETNSDIVKYIQGDH